MDTQLVNADTGTGVPVGSTLSDNHGGPDWTVMRWENPRHAGSSGRVNVSRPCQHTADNPCPWYCQGAEVRDFFPHVFGLKIGPVQA